MTTPPDPPQAVASCGRQRTGHPARGWRNPVNTPNKPNAEFALPDRIAIDAKGYGWRVWDGSDVWSMVPINPDNSPIPQPVTWYEREPNADEVLREMTNPHRPHSGDWNVWNDGYEAGTRPKRLRWSYRVERVSIFSDDRDAEAWLNELGADGWELAAIENGTAAFKRRRASLSDGGTPQVPEQEHTP
jgi:hypothetical protein